MTQPSVTKPAKRKRQRRVLPESIPDTLENVMDAIVTTPPKKRSEWKYLKRQKGTSNGTGGTSSDG